jgi:hypothetical protein
MNSTNNNNNNNKKVLNVVHSSLTDAFGYSGRYTGQMIVDSGNGLPHGKGIMEYDEPDPTATTTKTTEDHPSSLPLKYEGSWHKGHWHGPNGSLVLRNQDTYTGPFVHGKKHGSQGTYQWTRQQRVYSGNFYQDERHGHGTYTWHKSGATYVGSFVHNKRHGGQGTYTTPQLEYTGDWHDGQFHGYGTCHYNKGAANGGTTYEGHWMHGKKHGYGVETKTKDGEVLHDGEWDNDQSVIVASDDAVVATAATSSATTKENGFQTTNTQPHSSRSCQQPKPQQLEIVNGISIEDALGRGGTFRGMIDPTTRLPQGVGTMTYPPKTKTLTGSTTMKMTTTMTITTTGDADEDSQKQYEGFWHVGHFHGHGRLEYYNGDVYQGNFDQSQRHGGIGEYTCKDGRYYKGDWQHNQRHGLDGKLVFPNNDVYEGALEYNVRQGAYGKYVFGKDGSVYEGPWFNGRYQGDNGELVNVTTNRRYKGSFQQGLYQGLGTEWEGDVIVFEGQWEQGQPVVAATENGTEGGGEPQEKRPLPPIPYDIPKSKRETTDRGALLAINDADAGAGGSVKTVHSSTTNDFEDENDTSRPVVDLFLQDGQNNSGRYTGLVSGRTGLPNGVGRMVYSDNQRIHEGFWHHGHRQGHGRCIFIQIGDFHEGNYESNVRHGPGRYIWHDGRVFDGMYQNDERQGEGTFSYPNGDIYQGSFVSGQRQGRGTFVFHNKTCRYKGDWMGGLYHGQGRLLWMPPKNEDEQDNSEPISRGRETHVYIGEFQKGVFSGYGTHSILPNGTAGGTKEHVIVRQGLWEEGKFAQTMTTTIVSKAQAEDLMPASNEPALEAEAEEGQNRAVDAKDQENVAYLDDHGALADNQEQDEDEVELHGGIMAMVEMAMTTLTTES